MDRDELLALLVRAVNDGAITQAEMQAILARYDADELPPLTLPLPPREAVRPLDDDVIILAATLAMSLARDPIRDRFVREVAHLAPVAGADPRAWHVRMDREVRAHLAAQHMSGANIARVSFTERPRLDAAAMEQTGYLSRFADALAVRALGGAPLGEGQVAARGAQYAGAGYAEWFHANETLDHPGPGWVIDYKALDDRGTCGDCLDAERRGPFLPGSGPYPGVICQWRGHCRCIRVRRFAPDDYRRLTG